MRVLFFLAALFLLGASPALRAEGPIDDPGHLFFVTAADAATARAKLADLEGRDGLKVVLEGHLKSPSDDEDRVDGAYMTALSTRLGLVQKGVLMVYFADEKDWRVWIGNDLASTFAGRSASVQELTQSGQMHKAKEAYLEKAKAQADRQFQTRHGALPTPAEATFPEYLGLRAMALLDGLHEKLGTR